MDSLSPYLAVTNKHVLAIKAIIALSAVLLFVWWRYEERRGETRSVRARVTLLTLIGLLGFGAWTNFGRLHYSQRPYHFHEFFHYYLGAKYFPELRYDGLYDCVAAVEIERGQALEISSYWIRDLVTNRLRVGEQNLQSAAACRARFSPDRWKAFAADAMWIREKLSTERRSTIFTDHGYNPTPLWTVTGNRLSNTAPLSFTQMGLLALIDPILIVSMFALIWWAFGLDILCLALVWWGTSYPSHFSYVGGAFMRQDWLFLVLASLCLARRGFMAASGFALVWAAMLRIFPGFIGLGLLLKILIQCWRARRLALTGEQWRFAAGASLAVALLFPLSLAVGQPGQRLAPWTGFVQNSQKHLSTPATNSMGFRTVMSFEPSARVEDLQDYWIESPWDGWQAARRRTFADRKFLYWALVAGFVVLLGAAVRNRPDWEVLVLGVGAIPMLAEVSSYYYSMLLCFALLWERYRNISVLLATVTFLTAMTPAALESADERYTAMSAICVAFVVATTAALARNWRDARETAATTPEPASDLTTATAP